MLQGDEVTLKLRPRQKWSQEPSFARQKQKLEKHSIIPTSKTLGLRWSYIAKEKYGKKKILELIRMKYEYGNLQFVYILTPVMQVGRTEQVKIKWGVVFDSWL